jgi:hypothetical protein
LHNTDPESMLLFVETIETDRYSFDRLIDDLPVFAFAKGIHTEAGPVPPSAECLLCDTRWTPATGTCELR